MFSNLNFKSVTSLWDNDKIYHSVRKSNPVERLDARAKNIGQLQWRTTATILQTIELI